MKPTKYAVCALFGTLIPLIMACPTLAVPTFQTYIVGGTAGTIGEDEDTWFTTNTAFDLVLVGAYQGIVTNLTSGRLVVSVPEGETGTLTIDSLLPLATGADEDLLTNVAGNDGFDAKTDPPFPDTFNEHYPFKSSVSDFLLYDVGDFPNTSSFVHDYNADDGTITLSGNTGTEKTFAVTLSGFSSAHFDLFGFVTRSNGQNGWEINPGSHDSSYIPAPGALILGAVGAGFVSWLRRRKTF